MSKRPTSLRVCPSFDTTSRRAFLVATAASTGALVVGTRINFAGMEAAAATAEEATELNDFIKIAPDSTVIVIIKHLDKGQGITTGLATIVADELDADWAQMRCEFAPADRSKYYNSEFSVSILNIPIVKIQGTGGSTSVANSWNELRDAGARVRDMLVRAAAANWNAPAREITVKNGLVAHARTGRSATFGELVKLAKNAPPSSDVMPKQPQDWIYIRKQVPRIDSMEKHPAQRSMQWTSRCRACLRPLSPARPNSAAN